MEKVEKRSMSSCELPFKKRKREELPDSRDYMTLIFKRNLRCNNTQSTSKTSRGERESVTLVKFQLSTGLTFIHCHDYEKFPFRQLLFFRISGQYSSTLLIANYSHCAKYFSANVTIESVIWSQRNLWWEKWDLWMNEAKPVMDVAWWSLTDFPQKCATLHQLYELQSQHVDSSPHKSIKGSDRSEVRMRPLSSAERKKLWWIWSYDPGWKISPILAT